jgi:hypothetical protein
MSHIVKIAIASIFMDIITMFCKSLVVLKIIGIASFNQPFKPPNSTQKHNKKALQQL